MTPMPYDNNTHFYNEPLVFFMHSVYTHGWL